MICKLLLLVHAVLASSITAKLTELRLFGRKIFVTRVAMCQVDLLGIYGSCNFEYIISYVKLYSFVANINLIGLTLYLIHHSGCRGLLIFVIFIVFILIIISCVM